MRSLKIAGICLSFGFGVLLLAGCGASTPTTEAEVDPGKQKTNLGSTKGEVLEAPPPPPGAQKK